MVSYLDKTFCVVYVEAAVYINNVWHVIYLPKVATEYDGQHQGSWRIGLDFDIYRQRSWPNGFYWRQHRRSWPIVLDSKSNRQHDIESLPVYITCLEKRSYTTSNAEPVKGSTIFHEMFLPQDMYMQNLHNCIIFNLNSQMARKSQQQVLESLPASEDDHHHKTLIWKRSLLTWRDDMKHNCITI
jgi:hypothetical protein